MNMVKVGFKYKFFSDPTHKTIMKEKRNTAPNLHLIQYFYFLYKCIHYIYEYFMNFRKICSYFHNVYSDFIFLYAGCLPTAFTRRGLQWNAAWYAA